MSEYKIVEKRGWFWNLLHYVVMVVTLGGNRKFRSQYVTTLGPWIAVPAGSKIAPHTLAHELVHVRQFKWSAAGLPVLAALVFWLTVGWPAGVAALIAVSILTLITAALSPRATAALGIPTMFILYVLLPLPIGLAYFRYLFERAAYLEGIRASRVLYKLSTDGELSRVNSAVLQLTGPMYGWTWPFEKQVVNYFIRGLKKPIDKSKIEYYKSLDDEEPLPRIRALLGPSGR
jgi:hypothetical protein